MKLCEIFAESTHWTGSMADQKGEMIDNIMRVDTTDMEEFDIKDFAFTNQQNKLKLKKYCEPLIKSWQKSLPKNEYDELVQFMTYLNKKFEEEAV
jgi:ribosomal protein S3AE